jgi:hypothetical protein
VNFAQVLLLALAARHSWRPDALSRLLRRLGLRAGRPHPTSTPGHAKGINGRLPTHPRPEHHVLQSGARLRSVKALRSASTPTGGAPGLDGTVGLARKRPLRDAPESHPPISRQTRARKDRHHG